MTVKGGGFDSLSPCSGQDLVLFGDQWDRGYRYNSTSNSDLGKYENGHTGHYVEGISEHTKTKSILTVGTDGALNIWDSIRNKSSLRIPDVAGKNQPLTDLIITSNDMVVLAVFRAKSNILVLPFLDVGKMDFIALEGGHMANITRVKNLRDAPMFISLSGADIVGSMAMMTKTVLWESVFPPRRIA